MRIVLGDGQVMFRQGLRGLLERMPSTEVVGEGDDGDSTLRLIAERKPDVAIVDAGIRRPDLREVAAELRRLDLGTPIVVLAERDRASVAADLLEEGLAAYVLKRRAFDELAFALGKVMAGGTFVSPSLRSEEGEGRDDRDADARIWDLTSRERQILGLIGDGFSNLQISAQLRISVKTVETHRTNIREKLDLHTTPDLVRYATANAGTPDRRASGQRAPRRAR